MATVVAGTYELGQEIGAGGGGVVYLGTHLRLKKQIVLKADKGTLSADPEIVRREVDALKDLSHTYIPQVYDFVEEDGVIYTVMDYIEGESLDKPLKRGEHFSQPQVIEWACELLEALCYLHSRPPYGILHGDIKPANVMCTPQGDIRLIDFNIALALGEEGAVRVGFSRGYASPEHYGLDYSTPILPQETTGRSWLPKTNKTGKTGSAFPDKPNAVKRTSTASTDGSTTSEKRTILLDARSDIYSLGATLYHILSGVRPNPDAKQVKPLSTEKYSPVVVEVLKKAMEPDPARRYQTAKEMLYDFEHLREKDPRTRRHRRGIQISAGILAGAFLLGGGITFAGLKGMEREQAAAALAAQQAEDMQRQAKERERQEKQALAAVRNSESAYQKGDIPTAISSAMEALNTENPYQAQARKALTDALGVYDLFDGLKPRYTLKLPSEALKTAISPEGNYSAILYAYQVAVIDMAAGEIIANLPAQETAISGLCFGSGNVLYYAGADGVTAYDAAAQQTLWQGETATRLALSGDGQRLIAVQNDAEEAVLYDATDGHVIQRVSFAGKRQRIPAGGGILADPGKVLLALNQDGSLLAASFADGSVWMFDLTTEESYEMFEPSEYLCVEGGFSQTLLAFCMTKGGMPQFRIYDTQNGELLWQATGREPPMIQTDEEGIYVTEATLLVDLDVTTGMGANLAQAPNDILRFVRGSDGNILLAYEGGGYALFNAQAQPITQGVRENGCELLNFSGSWGLLASLKTPEVQILEMKRHPESSAGTYDPEWQHLETRLNETETTVMLFQYDRFYLMDRAGTLLCEVEIPDSTEVYDQQYRRDGDGSRLEVTYEDGLIRAYSGDDGSILWEKEGPVPEESLEEQFETSQWKIVAPLHDAPKVYNKETGEEVGTLEKDDYLMYVTEVGEYILTQYTPAEGEPYGLLLNQNLETLAYIPYLRDVKGDTLLMDDNMGNLRQCRIYSLSELMALAK